MTTENAQQLPFNPSTFINERKRGRAQGEKDTLARLGVSSTEEAISALAEYRRIKAAGGSDQAASQAAKEVAGKEGAAQPSGAELAAFTKLLDERLAPTTARIEALLKSQEDERARVAAAAKEAEAEREAKAADEAEEKKAAAALAREVKWFKKLALKEGVDESDPENMEAVLSLYEKRIVKMSDAEVDAAFGDDTDEEDRAAFVKAELAKIKKKAPGLFKAEAASGGEAATAKTAATTGKPQGTTEKAADPKAGKRVLDARKLSPKQFAEFRRNPTQFTQKFEAGLIDYETPAGAKK